MKQERLLAEVVRVIEGVSAKEIPADAASLVQVAEQIGKSFSVAADEVAILTLDDQRKCLQFIYPEKLKTIGTIPLSSTTALAARTAREKKAELANNFASVRHATVFEGVPLGRGEGKMIHKIMSAPLTAEDRVVGVIQISRKGRNALEAGPDFSSQDLRMLVAMSKLLGEFVLRLQTS